MIRRLGPITAIALLALTAASALGDDATAQAPTTSLVLAPPPNIAEVMTSPPASTSLLPWSAWRWEYAEGNHRLTVDGGLTSRYAPSFFGEPTATDVLASSITYRYSLFGGVVRPVARLTVGGARWLEPTGGAGFTGMTSNGTLFASAEAGLEIVVRGYGLGATAGYVIPVAFDRVLAMHDKHSGPAELDPDRADFMRQWRWNVYPIIEGP
jgi:hypothetical protein